MNNPTPQQLVTQIEELKRQAEAVALLAAEKLTQFATLYGEYEYFIVVEGKPKWARVYKPKGRFVYNLDLELGLRAKPENPVPVAVEPATTFEANSAKDTLLGPVIVGVAV